MGNDARATGNERANKQFEIYLLMAVRVASAIWKVRDDSDLAMQFLSRALYSQRDLPEGISLDASELLFNWPEVADYVAAHPMGLCETCGRAAFARHDGDEALCWEHWNERTLDDFIGDEPPDDDTSTIRSRKPARPRR